MSSLAEVLTARALPETPLAEATAFSCDSGDFGSGTSSSTKLIHGGLRYLEHYKFRLVPESLRERERLLQRHLISSGPCGFCCLTTSSRPRWMLRLGLFIYDHLAAESYAQAGAWIFD